jgi:glutamate/tyrosine decarboxylase-like PLP-dependent enzyme
MNNGNERLKRVFGRARARLFDFAFERAQRIGPIRGRIERAFDSLLEPATESLHPYRELTTHRTLPTEGLPRAALLDLVRSLSEREQSHWRGGQASGAVYHGDAEHIAFLNEIYGLTAQSNPLHTDIWPSARKFEAEVVAMTAHMLSAPNDDSTPEAKRIHGTVTSGGTESILLAMKAYRDRARQRGQRGRLRIVAPASAHAAFDKAAQLLDLELVRVPVGPDYRADLVATRRALGPRTLLVVGSAPSYPHGVIDPIAELGELCQERRLGLHVDACLGGFVLPWARRLGYPVPDFDFRIPGVTSISADTHKYGFAAKGTSVVLYRGAELSRHQYFVSTEWSGGLYFSPTLAGSRPGGLSAACWAAMLSIGENGYLTSTRSILETAAQIRRGIENIPELYVLGDPLWVIAFASHSLDIYRVLDEMSRRGFGLNGLQHPPAVHLCVTLRHTLPGVAERFLRELAQSVEIVRTTPPSKHGMAPVYGMTGSFPARGAIAELLRRYVERLYRP